MYQVLTIFSTLAIITGAGYYLYTNDVVGLVHNKESAPIVLTATSTESKLEGITFEKPNAVLADMLKGTYAGQSGGRVLLRVDGNASIISPQATYFGVWSIDDTGTITLQYIEGDTIQKKLFDNDQQHQAIIEVSSDVKTIYTRQ